MSNWIVIYYIDEDGKNEVHDYITSLNRNHQQKILAWIDMLEEEGPLLPRPFADTLKEGIHELRVKLSGNQIRVLYFFTFKNYIILTHAFSKNQSKVPDKEIKKAVHTRDEFILRFPTKLKFEKFLEEHFNDKA